MHPTPTRLPSDWLPHARRSLPRYTSYPTSLSFAGAENDEEARRWLSAIGADQAISAYVHVPFCRRLCWYCGCHTTVVHEYGRVANFHATLMREAELWADGLSDHGGLAHLHFGGGSPNALAPEDFLSLARLLTQRLGLRAGAEVAAELDPGMLTPEFIDASGEAGVTRISLGVQTFDPVVQAKVNRIQPFEMVAEAVRRIRAAGVTGLNFDLMYGLPAQTPDNVRHSVEAALALRPDRVAVFGYAHVPWMKKHQVMIKEVDLADVAGRWEQAEAADQALVAGGYVRIGLDHYALPDDALSLALGNGALRRNFQGYTDDPAPVLIPIGPSSIGRFNEGFVQNHIPTDAWAHAVDEGRLPVTRRLMVTAEDELRAAVIEQLMCNLRVDVGAVCREHGFAVETLDEAVAAAAGLQACGLAEVRGRTVRVPEQARRMMRVAASCFDACLPQTATRHARAV
jgi:oxygen-independent coproporphyrinogen-3 oxidase